jgi:hypothetical protein
MGKNMRRLLHLAIHHPGWHSYGSDMTKSVEKLREYGFVEVRPAQSTYRLIGNDKLFQMQSDISDMHGARRTQFTRCSCGHLYEVDLQCLHCKGDTDE